jgi:rSAM/selenodomain-associated transferase 1
MAKASVPGNVKTRLRLPPEEAAALQAALIRDTVEKARAVGPVTVAATPSESLYLIGPLLPGDVRLVVQRGEDLGERMLDAASCLFEEGPEPVIILGTDAPTLPLARIEEAAHALNTHDAFIVPSEDGGYVLIGLRTPYEALFRDITWSTETVYRETVEKARRAGLSVHEGATHYDVDTPEDLARLKAELQEHPEQAPHTAELVKTL